MECIYINLESRPDRRQRIERNFSLHQIAGWRLDRFEAVDAAHITASAVSGAATPAEKACFLSHRNLIRQHLSRQGPLMVLEDDAEFGAATFGVLDQTLSRLRDADWDIIFTDICVPDVGEWPPLVRLRRQYDQTRSFKLLSLSRSHFAGATSYVLNARSKQLLAELNEQVRTIDTPYDLHLRSLVHQGKLRAFAIFPFITSVSELADQSSIQAASSLDLVLNSFRRSVWVERDLNESLARVTSLRAAHGSLETAVFGGLFEAMLTDAIAPR